MRAMKGARGSRSEGGFTLIEVMIVVGILTFGLLSLAAMQIHAIQGSDRGRHASNAAAIAENRMEQLQQNSWASVGVTAGFVADPVKENAIQRDGAPDLVERVYNVSYQITDLQPTFTRAIDVRVSWTEESGKNRSITLSSVRFNREGT
ncbi:MAG TPA: prepilin-type N-terminal cleavage/methylation domain-containing protein [Myxococcota bacterium]